MSSGTSYDNPMVYDEGMYPLCKYSWSWSIANTISCDSYTLEVPLLEEAVCEFPKPLMGRFLCKKCRSGSRESSVSCKEAVRAERVPGRSGECWRILGGFNPTPTTETRFASRVMAALQKAINNCSEQLFHVVNCLAFYLSARLTERYALVKDTEESIQPMMKFARKSGILLDPTWSARLFSFIFLVYGIQCIAHLFYSAFLFSDDFDKMALTIYYNVLCVGMVVNLILLFQVRESYRLLYKDSCKSYDYGGVIMRKMQNEILTGRKNKNFLKMGARQPLMNVFMLGNLVCTSLMDKYLNGAPHLAVYPIWYPTAIDLDNFFVNTLAYLHQLFSMVMVGLSIFTLFGTCFVAFNHISSELVLLSTALTLLPERAREMAEEKGIDMGQAYSETMRMCSHHHTCILQYFHKIQPSTQIIYSIIYLFGLFLLIFTGIAFMRGNTTIKMNFVVIYGIELAFIFFISWFSQEISENGKLTNVAVYNVDWMPFLPDAKSNLKILLLGSQRSLVMRSSFGQQIDLDGYMSLLNAAYTYFNLLLVAAYGDEAGF